MKITTIAIATVAIWTLRPSYVISIRDMFTEYVYGMWSYWFQILCRFCSWSSDLTEHVLSYEQQIVRSISRFIVWYVLRRIICREEWIHVSYQWIILLIRQVVINVIISVSRCLVSMVVNATSQFGGYVDVILWVFVRFSLLLTEISVIIFGLAFGKIYYVR